MRIKAPKLIVLFLTVALLFSSCAYVERVRLKAEHKKIENSISTSRLENANVFFGKAPLSKAYEFNFINTQKDPFSLLFTVHEGSFSSSTLKYRSANRAYRDSNLISNEVGVLNALNESLPKPTQVAWYSLDPRNVDEAEEGYRLMLEYIRFKIRNL